MCELVGCEVVRACDEVVSIDEHYVDGDSSAVLNYWIDWCPNDKMVYFGGMYGDVPPMPAEVRPSHKEVAAWTWEQTMGQ